MWSAFLCQPRQVLQTEWRLQNMRLHVPGTVHAPDSLDIKRLMSGMDYR